MNKPNCVVCGKQLINHDYERHGNFCPTCSGRSEYQKRKAAIERRYYHKKHDTRRRITNPQ